MSRELLRRVGRTSERLGWAVLFRSDDGRGSSCPPIRCTSTRTHQYHEFGPSKRDFHSAFGLIQYSSDPSVDHVPGMPAKVCPHRIGRTTVGRSAFSRPLFTNALSRLPHLCSHSSPSLLYALSPQIHLRQHLRHLFSRCSFVCPAITMPEVLESLKLRAVNHAFIDFSASGEEELLFALGGGYEVWVCAVGVGRHGAISRRVCVFVSGVLLLRSEFWVGLRSMAVGRAWIRNVDCWSKVGRALMVAYVGYLNEVQRQ